MSVTVALDSYSLIFRSFYAVAGPAGAADPQTSVGVLRRLISGILPGLQPGYVLAACDLPGPCFRSSLDPEYKASRKPKPDGLEETITLGLAALRDAGLPVLSCEDFEADDVLATMAAKIRPGHRLIVVSSDRDLIGLISEQVDLLLVRSAGQHRRYTHADAHEVFGVVPGLVADYKAMVGDSADNIPGVTGIGPKTAISLLEEHGNLEGILAAVDQLPKRWAGKFDEAGIAQARVCFKLAQLRGDVPVQIDARQAHWTAEKAAALRG